MQQTAIIIGAGPAGLTAAFELLERTGIVPIVLEAEDYVGGISPWPTTRATASISAATVSSRSRTA